MRKIFPIFAIVLGLFWAVMAIDYGLWVRRGPGGGFFPLIAGLLAAVFGAFYLMGEIKSPKPARIDKKFAYPILAALGMLFASYLVGLLPAMLLYIFCWLKFYEKFSLRYSSTVAACTIGGLYAVFVYWLSVPLPTGMLGKAIFG